MIQIAVIGAGHWGPNLIRNFNNGQKSNVVRVIDRDEQRLAQVKLRFPEIATSSDANDAFSDPSVDAVVIATPTSTHFDLVKAALEANKHVLVEKPISHSVETSDALIALAKSKNCVLMVGHVFLFNGAVREASRILETGAIGTIFHISMVSTNHNDMYYPRTAGQWKFWKQALLWVYNSSLDSEEFEWQCFIGLIVYVTRKKDKGKKKLDF
jgi:predicted dehydrogenase